MANIPEEDPFLAAAKDPNGEFARLTQKTTAKKPVARKVQAQSLNGPQASSEVKEKEPGHFRGPSGQSHARSSTTATFDGDRGGIQPHSASSDGWTQQSGHMSAQPRPRVDEKLDAYEPAVPPDFFKASHTQYSGITQMNIATRVESFESSVMAEVVELKKQISDIKSTVTVLTEKVQNRDGEILTGSVSANNTNGSSGKTPVASEKTSGSKAREKSDEAPRRIEISISSGQSTKRGKQDMGPKRSPTKSVDSDINRPAPGGGTTPLKTSQDPRFPSGMPEYISQLQPYRSSQLQFQPLARTESPAMSRRLLVTKLGGEEFSPNFYYRAKALAGLAGSPSTPVGKDGEQNYHECFYLLDMETNPFAPFKPGAHGAALLLFSRDAEDDSRVSYTEVPVFVALAGQTDRAQDQKEYVYMGHFSQTRWSDRLGCYEQKSHVSEPVKKAWSDVICTTPRPAWLDKQLDEWIDRGPSWRWVVPNAGRCPEQGDLEAFFDELRDAKSFCEEFKEELTQNKVMELFDTADCDAPPGLRFSWEYLQCVHYDRNFAYAIKSLESADTGGKEPKTGAKGSDTGGKESNGAAAAKASPAEKTGDAPFGNSTADHPVDTFLPDQFSWD